MKQQNVTVQMEIHEQGLVPTRRVWNIQDDVSDLGVSCPPFSNQINGGDLTTHLSGNLLPGYWGGIMGVDMERAI